MLAAAMFETALAQPGAELFDMTIEELTQVNVVSMSRRASTLSSSPAAVYVISGEEIRRSGASSIPEALRLAPGVEVARDGTGGWTVSIRGFNSNLSDKLLVLIDSRSVYTPLYGGVYWDAQDTLMADIDRIEVIAGPGGTIWGANAVNGVINIITKSAQDTVGGYAEIGGGDGQDAFMGFRYGAEISDTASARAYVKYFERELSVSAAGDDIRDEWQGAQAGFNVRWDISDRDRMTLRGDVYDGDKTADRLGDFEIGTFPETEPATVDIGGRNILGRWRRTLSDLSSLRLQIYIDETDRLIPGNFDESRTTYDVDFQHDLEPLGRHSLTWGSGVRVTSDDIGSSAITTFTPQERTDRIYSAFLQDRIAFNDGRMELTLGSKLEQNDYSGFEAQPSARFLWSIDSRNTFWTSVSRAVRTPVRLNTDINFLLPIFQDPFLLYLNVEGNPEFETEELFAAETGYRTQLTDRLSLDVAVFENRYDNLFTQEVGDPIFETDPVQYVLLPAVLGNGMNAQTHGGTIAVAWQPLERWRLRMHYSRLQMDLWLDPDSTDTGALDVAGNSPRHQVNVHSFGELPHGLSLYLGARYVDTLPNQNLDSQFLVDASIGWEAADNLDLSLSVRNLNDRRHVEFGGTAIERSVYFTLSRQF